MHLLPEQELQRALVADRLAASMSPPSGDVPARV
jgi:hypothetical protein